MMYWHGDGMGGWGYGLMAISLVLLSGAVIYGIVALARYLGREGRNGAEPPGPPRPAPPHPPDPPDVDGLLAARFARGEIGEEEYQRRLAVLHGTVRAAGPGNQAAAR